MVATTRPEPVPVSHSRSPSDASVRREPQGRPEGAGRPSQPASNGSSGPPDRVPRRRKPRKAQGKEIKGQYVFTLEVSFVIVFGLLIGLLRAPLDPGGEQMNIVMDEQEVVNLEEVQQTRQMEQPPPPPRPPVPVEVPNTEVLEDEVLDLDASLDLDDPVAATDAPPPPPEEPEDEAEEAEDEVFVVVEQMPELIGGVSALQNNVRYPEIARRAGVEGRVFVQFVVTPEGRPSNPQVIRGIGAGCDEEAVRAIMEHARFEPGMQRGKPVSVRMSIPINFRLKNSE